jgi:hypothetical protein
MARITANPFSQKYFLTSVNDTLMENACINLIQLKKVIEQSGYKEHGVNLKKTSTQKHQECIISPNLFGFGERPPC